MTAKTGSLLCAVIGRTRHKMMQAEIQQASKQGAKLIELRLDFLAKPPDFKRLLAQKSCPMIATVRRSEDGGRWAGTEEDRLVLLRQAIVAGFDWIDLETDIAERIPRFGKVRRIVSYHNLREVPANLEEIYKKMCEQDADIVKLAVTAQDSSDNLRVLKLLQNRLKPTIAHCMGDLGTASRVLGGKFGAPFIYGAFNKERNIAPGILSFAELRKIYRVESLNADTEIYGVLGDPVGHSLSPLLHNQVFAKFDMNAVYVPFRVPRGELGPFLKNYEKLVQGLSVTIPHKEMASRAAKWKGPAVEKINAANTLVRSPEGWRAYNTDGTAALESLKAFLDLHPELPPLGSLTVMIAGAGGTAHAVAQVLQEEGVNLMITNRTSERSQKLAQEVGCRAVEWQARHNTTCDVFINCTAVGMHPNLDESPVHNSYLRPNLVVFETIYTPETTLLVREARSRGAHVLTGVDMFVRQAALQFKLFTGIKAPLELMQQLVHKALSPVNLGHDDTRI